MTTQLMTNLYDNLTNNSSLTSIVSADDIDIGWQTEDINYPSISITQAGGGAIGQLGYKDKNRTLEDFVVQIDIYSDTSAKKTYNICDEIENILVSSNYEKTADSDMWEPDLNAHRKTTQWRLEKYLE